MGDVKAKKPMVTDIFVEGAKKGWVIATTSTVPNVLMAFVIIKALQITGALDLMGTVFSPIMAVFGLPGEAAAVLIGAWMSMGGAVASIVIGADATSETLTPASSVTTAAARTV